MSLRPETKSYRPDIDGLRAVAVLLVVGYHAFPGWVSGGFVGVDVFFVISGYLISKIVADGIERGSFRFRDFYARRIRRIFPALLVVLLAVLLGAAILFQPDELQEIKREIIASGLFVPNILLWHDTGYFDTDAKLKPLLHLWSLGVEEQFYLIWPVVLVLVGKRSYARVWIMLAFAVVSFALNVALVEAYPAATFYLPLSRFWEFLSGAILAAIPSTRPGVSAKLATPLSLAGVLSIVLSGLIFADDMLFPGWIAVFPVVGASLIILAGPAAWPNRYFLSHPVAVYVGLISYPLYLWHWPLLSFARIENFGANIDPVTRLALVALSFALAALTYALVEKRLRFGSPKRTLAVALAAGMAVIVVSASALMPLQARLRSQTGSLDAKQLTWSYWDNADCGRRFPWSDKRGWWFCITSSEKPPSMIILGDSHANHLFPGLAKALPHHSILNIGTCPPVTGLRFFTQGVGERPCAGYRKSQQEKFIFDLIKGAPDIRYAILGASWPAFTRNGAEADPFSGQQIPNTFGNENTPESGSQRDKYRKALERTIEFLQSRHVRPILFLGVPNPSYDIRNCYARPFLPARETCVRDGDEQRRARASFLDLTDALRRKYPALLVFDPLPAFCGAESCRLREGQTPLFRDNNHLSSYGSDVVADEFVTWARANAPELVAAPSKNQ